MNESLHLSHTFWGPQLQLIFLADDFVVFIAPLCTGTRPKLLEENIDPACVHFLIPPPSGHGEICSRALCVS